MNTTPIKITLIGHGNVGSHLAQYLNASGVHISHVFSRSENKAQKLSERYGSLVTSNFNDLPAHQLCLVCVNDHSIHEVISQLNENTPVAYTSGSVPLSNFERNGETGVFYPLQTFSKGKQLDISEVPFLIEASSKALGEQLFSLASMLSKKVVYANSTERSKLHLSAVWTNNFTNHMMHIAEKYALQNNVDFTLLKPLLNETVRKLDYLSPLNAQTGPARRNDDSIIQEHASQLNGIDKELYLLISKSIQNTYSKDEEL